MNSFGLRRERSTELTPKSQSNGFSPEVRKNEVNRPRESQFQGKIHLSDETVSTFKKVVT